MIWEWLDMGMQVTSSGNSSDGIDVLTLCRR